MEEYIYSFHDIIFWSDNINYIRNNNIKIKVSPEATKLFKNTTITEKYKNIIENLDVSEVTNMDYYFYNTRFKCAIDLSKWNTSNVKSMQYMFSCANLNKYKHNLNFDTSNVEYMSYMFADTFLCKKIKLFKNVSNVKYFDYMFYKFKYLYNIAYYLEKWNVQNAVSTAAMFFGCDFDRYKNINLNNWNMSNVTTMYKMFAKTNFNGNISLWDVSNVKNMGKLFYNSTFNNDISKWNTANVINMHKMFCKTIFNKNISEWDVSNVKNMSFMFCNSEFNNGFYDIDADSDITEIMYYYSDTDSDSDRTPFFISNEENDDTETASNISSELSDDDITNNYRETSLHILMPNQISCNNILKWNTANVTNMYKMFYKSNFNGNISNWNTCNVINMSYMFAKSHFSNDISNWNTSNVRFMRGVFEKSKFNISENLNWDVSNVTDMTRMFKNSIYMGDISKWNIKNVIHFTDIFTNSRIQIMNIPILWKTLNSNLYNYIKNMYIILRKVSNTHAIENNEMCMICKLNIGLNDHITSCKNVIPHYYHINCLERWIKASNNHICICKKTYNVLFE